MSESDSSNMVFTLFFLLLLQHSVLLLADSAYQTNLNDDVLGLIVFKAALVDPDSVLASWNEEDNTPCFWFGIKCDPFTRRVTDVSLDNCSLSGHVGRGLLRLQSLRTLSLKGNNLTGLVNPDLTRMLPVLRFVDFSSNGFSGSIPGEFFQQCGSLTYVSLAENSLEGEIPDSLSSCFGLTHLNFSSNRISGEFPAGVWNLRSLQVLDLSGNLLEGEIPRGVSNLYDLRRIALNNNKLSGELPADIGSCSFLEKVDFAGNFFSGEVPESVKRLNSCIELRLGGNQLTGFVPGWIGELKSIESLDLSSNRFSGRIPGSIGDMNKLKELNLSMNQLNGGLPDSISNCVTLLSLDLRGNQLSGDVPSWLFKSSLVLQKLDVSSNGLSGEIPSDFSGITSSSILVLNLSRNQLFGSIPSTINQLKSIQVVDFSGNKLTGEIPSQLCDAAGSSLLDLRFDRNFLSGRLPARIDNCSSLTSLMLSKNNLTGEIPAAIANLTNLEFLDLSFNNFSGSLPKELANLSRLASFNVSNNRLEGELPVGGFFNIISPSSISGNPSLCGSAVNRSCPSVHPKPIVLNPNSSSRGPTSSNISHRKIALSISALVAIGAAVCIVVGVIAVTLLNIHVRSSMARMNGENQNSTTLFGEGDDGNYTSSPDPNYGKLVMFSGDAEFVAGGQALLNKDCEIGRGGFGVVYKTSLRDGRSVAIKKLMVSSLIKSQVEFETEVMKLGKARHYNVVALEGYYWTPSLQLLIYEYVSDRSLYKLLHNNNGEGSSRYLTWRERFNIVAGMAKGIAHLHQMKIIHYNLKSTNVLVDDESGEAKVGDYGLAKLLPTLDRCILSSKMQSALGYMAPEFACKTVKITEKCDVYGFGVLVLEVVTARRPVEYMEDDVVVLSDTVRGALEDGKVEEIVDPNLRGNFPSDEAIPLVKLGLICASQVPSNRPDMEEVLNILDMIQCPPEGQEVVLE
ncbi:Leucine-rich repeat receptor-like protein kinase PXC2 [Linum grandiflorum]